MKRNTISVIVPIYNQEEHLEDCLNSLITQTYNNLDIILVNDGSTDRSQDICNRYSHDKRVNVINKPNGGINSARTAGLEKAKGDLITFVDSDDVVEKNTYMLVNRCFEQYDCDLVGFRYVLEYKKRIRLSDNVDEDNIKEIIINKDQIYDNFLGGVKLGGVLWNKVWKRECLKDVKFRDDIFLCEDAVYVWNTLAHIKRAVIIDEPLYHYRFSFTNATHSSSIEKYYTSIIAWDYIKESAKNVELSNIDVICKGRLRWLLKTAKCLANTNPNKQDFDEIAFKIKEDEKYIRQLSKYEKISIGFLLKRRYRFFKTYNSFETFLKRVYVFYRKIVNCLVIG